MLKVTAVTVSTCSEVWPLLSTCPNSPCPNYKRYVMEQLIKVEFAGMYTYFFLYNQTLETIYYCVWSTNLLLPIFLKIQFISICSVQILIKTKS